jgi:uncharacterized iron-regulated membrane protein
VWVDQYTGEVKGMNRRLPFFQTMFYLHRWLLNKEQPADGGIWWGKMIVGWSVLAFVVVLISGVIIWWPRTKSAIANRFKVCFGKGSLRLWHDSHVSLGIYAAIFLLASAVTGLTWSFQWYNKAFYSLFGVDTAAMQQHGGKGGDKGGNKGEKGGKPQFAEHGQHGHGEGRPEGRSHGEGRGDWHHSHADVEEPTLLSPFAHWQQTYERISALQATSALPTAIRLTQPPDASPMCRNMPTQTSRRDSADGSMPSTWVHGAVCSLASSPSWLCSSAQAFPSAVMCFGCVSPSINPLRNNRKSFFSSSIKTGDDPMPHNQRYGSPPGFF